MLDTTEHFALTGQISAEDADGRRRVHDRELTAALTEPSQTISEMRGRGMAVPALEGQQEIKLDADARGVFLGLED